MVLCAIETPFVSHNNVTCRQLHDIIGRDTSAHELGIDLSKDLDIDLDRLRLAGGRRIDMIRGSFDWLHPGMTQHSFQDKTSGRACIVGTADGQDKARWATCLLSLDCSGRYTALLFVDNHI